MSRTQSERSVNRFNLSWPSPDSLVLLDFAGVAARKEAAEAEFRASFDHDAMREEARAALHARGITEMDDWSWGQLIRAPFGFISIKWISPKGQHCSKDEPGAVLTYSLSVSLGDVDGSGYEDWLSICKGPVAELLPVRMAVAA